MGIVFGKQKDNVKVLTIRQTQSLPAVKIQRKFGKVSGSERTQPTRSTSYQTTLPGLPNLISSDEDGEEIVSVPPPFTLPPLSHKLSLVRDHTSTPKIVAELSSATSDEYSSCVEDLTVYREREKTTFVKEILLGSRLDELRTIERQPNTLSSRESRKILSSRDSYRKTYLRSRKRPRKNRCLSSESSLSKSSTLQTDEDTLPPSGDDTMSDVKVLISDKQKRRNVTGCRISRKSTLNSALKFNSSSEDGIQACPIRYHLSKRDRMTRRSRISGRNELEGVIKERTVTSGVLGERSRGYLDTTSVRGGVRVSSAWQGHSNNLSKHQIGSEQDSYDASSELSSSDSDDQLNYSNRFKTNPFLITKTSLYHKRPIKTHQPELVSILPNYAKSSYNTPPSTSQHFQHTNKQTFEQSNMRRHKRYAAKRKITQPNVISTKQPGLSPRSQFMINKQFGTENKPNKRQEDTKENEDKPRKLPEDTKETEEKPRRQNDEFDELDSAVEMFKLLL